MAKMTKEEMARQDLLPFEEQSEAFLRICVDHGTPCVIHGGKCDHTVQWLRLYQHAIALPRQCKGVRLVSVYRFFDELLGRTVLARPWSVSCHFDINSWATEALTKKRIIEGIGAATSAGYVIFTPDEGQQYKGTIAWNTEIIPLWMPPPTQTHPKEDRVLQTLEELQTSGKLSETWHQRPTKSAWAAIRVFVLERDDYTCQYCGKTTGTMHCDHIVPISRGGTNDPDNLVTACESCNLHKHARTLEEWLS